MIAKNKKPKIAKVLQKHVRGTKTIHYDTKTTHFCTPDLSPNSDKIQNRKSQKCYKNMFMWRKRYNMTRKRHKNYTFLYCFLKRHGLWRKKVFYVALSWFFFDISESVHLIFTRLRANEITHFSASIGTNIDKIGQKLSKNGL